MNDLFSSILIDMVLWSLILVSLIGFCAVVWEAWRHHTHSRQHRKAWERMPMLEPGRPNIRIHKVL